MSYTSSDILPWDFTEAQILHWFQFVAESEGKILAGISMAYYSDEGLLEVNRTYLQHDYYTDIITFDRCRGIRIKGDLAISVDRIVDHALVRGLSINCEAARVHVHGLLHLCGYNDQSEKQKLAMRNLENKYLDYASDYGIQWT